MKSHSLRRGGGVWGEGFVSHLAISLCPSKSPIYGSISYLQNLELVLDLLAVGEGIDVDFETDTVSSVVEVVAEGAANGLEMQVKAEPSLGMAGDDA